MSAPQAAAITACTACAAVGGAAAGGAFSSGTSVDEDHNHEESQNGLNQEVSSSDKSTTTPPTYTFQSQEVTTGFSYTEGLIGKKYENYLIGIYGTSEHSNEEYWKLVYKKYTTDIASEASDTNLSEEFKKTAITEAFASSSDNEKNALNKACEKLYKKEHANHIKTGSDSSKNKTTLWKYCSELGEEPKTVAVAKEETVYTTESFIGKTKKDVILAVTQEHNKKLWEWKNNEFKSKNEGSITGSDYFTKALEKAKKDVPEITLKKACEEAYKKTSATGAESETSVTDSNVVKFCSLDGE